jgi:hypothetical protein
VREILILGDASLTKSFIYLREKFMKKLMLATSLALTTLTAFAGDFTGDFFSIGVESGYTSGDVQGKSVNGVPVKGVGILLLDDGYFGAKVGTGSQGDLAQSVAYTYALSLDGKQLKNDKTFIHIGGNALTEALLGYGTFHIGVGYGKNDKEIIYLAPVGGLLGIEGQNEAWGLGLKAGAHVRILQNIQLRASGEYLYLTNDAGHLISYTGAAIVNTPLVYETMGIIAEASGLNILGAANGKNTAIYSVTAGVIFAFSF